MGKKRGGGSVHIELKCDRKLGGKKHPLSYLIGGMGEVVITQ